MIALTEGLDPLGMQTHDIGAAGRARGRRGARDGRHKRGGLRFATVFIDTRDQFDVFVGFEPRSAAGAIASALKP